jgi:hypothetical protein
MDSEDADAAIGLSFLAMAAGAKVLRTTFGYNQATSQAGATVSEVWFARLRAIRLIEYFPFDFVVAWYVFVTTKEFKLQR